LLSEVDCIDIVSPTVTHYAVAKEAILQGKHVFVEKPLTETVAQAAELVSLAREYKSVVQVGHVERYNPAFRSLTGIQLNPKFIEAHRLAMFNGRGTDVSVVLDLMIHDLDIVLHLIRDEVADVRANGVSIVSPTPDICNARIEFRGGAVANLTASRISMKTMRKIRIFQGDAYIGLDLLEKQAQIIRISEGEQESDAMTLHTAQGIRQLTIESPPIMQQNAILEELTDFYYSISEGRKVSVSIEDGYKALSLAHVIQNQIL
jgi:predicted dehydrogenase